MTRYNLLAAVASVAMLCSNSIFAQDTIALSIDNLFDLADQNSTKLRSSYGSSSTFCPGILNAHVPQICATSATPDNLPANGILFSADGWFISRLAQ